MKSKAISYAAIVFLIMAYYPEIAFGQGFSGVRSKIEELESRLTKLETADLNKLGELETQIKDLEATEKTDFRNLEKLLSKTQPDKMQSNIGESLSLLESRVDNLIRDFDVIQTDNNYPRSEFEITELTRDLRELVGELRTSIESKSNNFNEFPGSANPWEKISMEGSVRWRSEFDDKDFVDSTAMYERTFLRMRFGTRFQIGDNSLAYIQFQDSRNVGTNSAGLTNDSNLGIHQAYIKVAGLFNEGFTLQIGRFGAPYGRERLLGTVGWHNVGRTFDGIRGNYASADYKIDVFTLKIDDRSFNSPPNENDWTLYGAYGFFMEDRFHLFALYDWDQEPVNGADAMKRSTIGAYYKHTTQNDLKLELDAAIQRGSQDTRKVDGYIVAGDISYGFKREYKPVLGIGIDITSGDDGSDSTTIKSFNNLYYTGHKFRGFMDYFLGPTKEGLVDLVLHGGIKPSKVSLLKVDFHFFKTMENLAGADSVNYKDLGQEIDITAKYTWEKGITFQGGFSAFLASDNWKPEVSRTTWLYGMIVASF